MASSKWRLSRQGTASGGDWTDTSEVDAEEDEEGEDEEEEDGVEEEEEEDSVEDVEEGSIEDEADDDSIEDEDEDSEVRDESVWLASSHCKSALIDSLIANRAAIEQTSDKSAPV